MMTSLPRGEGTAIFTGGGWRRPHPVIGSTRAHDRKTFSDTVHADDTLVLRRPLKVLTAREPDDVHGLLDEVEREQREGRYVAGYLSYEAGAAFGLDVRTPQPDALPLAWMAVYDPRTVTPIPNVDWEGLLASTDFSRVAEALADIEPRLSVSHDDYLQAVHRVREYIAAGDTYQVNYTVRADFEIGGPAADAGASPPDPPMNAVPGNASLHMDPLEHFLALLARQPVPYAAYLDMGESQVISLSPEMFLRRTGRHLESRPMKGTRPRGATHTEDVALAYDLAQSVKDRAENLMIVDMVRNDLGRVCRAGSVHVPTLYAVEPYRTVWQMVSTVTGEARPRAPLAEIMQAVFPGASITGAPKHHTMELIAELETEPRGVYTGAIGLFAPGGDLTANIAIRTIVNNHGRCRLGIGSGVIWDSDAEAEYEETLVKATFATPSATKTLPRGGTWRLDPGAALRVASTAEDFYLFETILLETATETETGDIARCEQLAGAPKRADVPDLLNSLSDEAVLARYRFLEEHLDRMAASAHTLRLPFERDGARGVMVGLARVHPEPMVVRIQVDAAGRFSLSTRETPESPAGPVDLLVSPFRTDPADPLLAHKTSQRGFYNREHRRALSVGCFDSLFLNRKDHVTEGAITNIFARFGDDWLTPPLIDGLLPGLWRASFISQTDATEAPLSLQDLYAADEIVVGNSVRGAVSVDRIRVEPLTF